MTKKFINNEMPKLSTSFYVIVANNVVLSSRITYWTSGTFMLVNANAFNQIGGMDFS